MRGDGSWSPIIELLYDNSSNYRRSSYTLSFTATSHPYFLVILHDDNNGETYSLIFRVGTKTEFTKTGSAYGWTSSNHDLVVMFREITASTTSSITVGIAGYQWVSNGTVQIDASRVGVKYVYGFG